MKGNEIIGSEKKETESGGWERELTVQGVRRDLI